MTMNSWTTKDFYSAVILRAFQIPMIDVIRGDGNFVVFKFDADPNTCEALLSRHWNRELHCETRLLIETIKEIKTRLFERMKDENN